MSSPSTDMVKIPSGTFMMGSTDFYPEERPIREVKVGAFLMDESPVTNLEFQRFVEDTGYVTCAERPVTSEHYPDADPSLLVPGSSVFHRASGPVDLRDLRNWWTYVPGAHWRHPEGPDSDLAGRGDHPVVHIAYEDASTYARWAKKQLPSEAEWEFAARGGASGARYAWGDELTPGGRHMANIWEGEFPWRRRSRYERTSPVGAFPVNGYGLYDMIGNVWEWTADQWSTPRTRPTNSCCSGESQQSAAARGRPHPERSRVVKGGSYLCASNYCRRYRPAARQEQLIDSSTSHIGFRCVRR